MKQRSWIILAICLALATGLVVAFLLSQGGPKQLTQQDAVAMTQSMEQALRDKNTNAIMAYFSSAPDTRIAGINQDQFRVLLARYFRNSDQLSAEMKNYVFAGGDTEASLQFDVIVHNDGSDSRKEDYPGHITLHLKRVDVPHLLGIYQSKEWRIASAETTGPDLSTFGD